MDSQQSRRLFLQGTLSAVGTSVFLTESATAQTNARRISYGETKDGEIDSQDPEYVTGFNAEQWIFDGEQGDEIELEVTAGDLEGVQYSLENPDEAVMDHSGTDGGWIGYATALPQSSSYSVWVWAYPENHYGTYTLSLVKHGDGHFLTPGDSVTETLSRGDIDWGGFSTDSGTESTAESLDLYRLQGTAGQTVSITVQNADFTPKIAAAPLYTDGYNADIQEGSTNSPRDEANLTHEFGQDGDVELIVTAVENTASGEYTLAVAESDTSSISANIGPQAPKVISSYPYTETHEIVWDNEYHDGMKLRVDRSQLSETEYRLSFRFESLGTPVDVIHGYMYSQILVLLSNISIVRDEVQAQVNGGDPWGLVLADLVRTASGGIENLVKEPIEELSQTVVEEKAKDEVTSRLQFRVPPDVESVDDVTALRIDFSTDQFVTSPASIEEFELEMRLSTVEADGQPSVSIIPDIRGKTIGQPSDNISIQTSLVGAVPFEYRRQLIATFPESSQDPANTSYEVVGHHLCSDVQDPGENASVRCIGSGSTFSTDERRVYDLIEIANTPTGLTVEWEWYTPSGDLYAEHTETNSQGFSEFWATSYIDVRGETPATLPGEWSVRTIINRGEEEFTQRFTIQ